MTLTITDGEGRVWECRFGALEGDQQQQERVILHCTCGELRAAVAVPRDWQRLPEADLRRRLEQVTRLRERGRG